MCADKEPVCIGTSATMASEGEEADKAAAVASVASRLFGTSVGTDSVIIAYTCNVPDGPDRTGSDIMFVNDAGKIVDWRSHYTFTPDDAPELITD